MAARIPHSLSFVGTIDVGVALREDPQKPSIRLRDLALPTLVGTLGLGVGCVREPWVCTVAGLVFLMCGGPRFISSTYTLWNWTIVLAQVADRAIRSSCIPHLLPFLVVNSWAIFTSFNVCALFHPGYFSELAKRLDYSLLWFHFMNTLGHFVPPAFLTLWFLKLDKTRRADTCGWTSVVPLPFAGLAFHLLWALRVGGSLRLDHVYLKRPKRHWYIAWTTAAITHIAVGVYIDKLCHD